MQSVARDASSNATEAWRQVDQQAISATWTAQLPAVVAAVTAAQAAAAELAIVTTATPAVLVAGTFAGASSSGQSLIGLLFQPAVSAMVGLATGSPAARVMAGSSVLLDAIVRTQVADAFRVAKGVAITANPDFYGYERFVHLPACGRCIVLAGRVYRWSQGFSRHPRCDCTMAPVTHKQHRDANLDNHPRALFDRMSTSQQDQRLGAANAAAIRDGADISQVVNAKSGMSTTDTKTAHVLRLTPEAIYKITNSREEAIGLLRQHGYIL
jgi:hypothetical protein